MESTKVSVKQMMEIKDVVIYLEDLIDSFKSGKIVVQKADQHVTLTPPEKAIVEVEAKVKEGSQKFSLELSWKSAECLERMKAPLTISPEEPDLEEAEIEEEEEEDVEEEEEEEEKDKKKKK